MRKLSFIIIAVLAITIMLVSYKKNDSLVPNSKQQVNIIKTSVLSDENASFLIN